MSESPLAEKPNVATVIGTHDGTFHCDEVLACWLLKQLPQYRDASIVRTRDSEKLSTCDVVVDVGAVYDPAKHRYDHHQRSFDGTMMSLGTTLGKSYEWSTKLSSAGLVFLHFGQKVLAELCCINEDTKNADLLYSKMYENFVEAIDAVDNGISQYDGEPRYRVTSTISSRVGGFNPAWNAVGVSVDERFKAAMKMVGDEFVDKLTYFKDAWLPARTLVEDAFSNRLNVDSSGAVMCLSNGGCPWKEHLFSLEEEANLVGTLKFVLYPDENSNWRVQTVPDRPVGSFGFRVGICKSWRGLRDDALSSESGIEGCIFVHTSGFIGGNKTYEGALIMAKRSIAEASEEEKPSNGAA